MKKRGATYNSDIQARKYENNLFTLFAVLLFTSFLITAFLE
tara:strand:- start:413 stop:535 length:123 start_codon:yes stop_codon:yes gene_type:complete